MALVTEDRKTQGLHLKSSITDNVALPLVGRLARFGIRVVRKGSAAWRDTPFDALGIRCSGIEQTAGTLSGGNQQKVVIGKWLATRPRVLLLDEPTRGIDVGAKREIYDLIFRLARQEGLAIVVVSSELPELLLLSDRILVMAEGRQTGIISRADASEERIMQLAAPHGATRKGRMSVLRLLSRTKLYWGLIAIFLIGVLVLAGQFQGQQHLPVLRQFARRAAAGVDHRADRNWHDRGHHHRRHRPVRRVADGDLQRRLRHAAHRPGRHAGGGDGPADGWLGRAR